MKQRSCIMAVRIGQKIILKEIVKNEPPGCQDRREEKCLYICFFLSFSILPWRPWRLGGSTNVF
jgi:hypothetical protein